MDTENGVQSKPGPKALTGKAYYLKTFHVSMNLLCHILVGIIVGVNIVFVFRLPLPLGKTPLHIVLCVLGVSVFFYIFYPVCKNNDV